VMEKEETAVDLEAAQAAMEEDLEVEVDLGWRAMAGSAEAEAGVQGLVEVGLVALCKLDLSIQVCRCRAKQCH